jgi:signal peptidase II
MNRITRMGWLAYGCAVLAVIVDQIAKTLVVTHLGEGVSHAVVWPLAFHRTWNDGVSFGLLQAGGAIGRWAFVAFSLGVATLLAVWANKSTRLPAVGLGLVMGGAIGNALDRALYGRVVDFLDASALGFFPWIFNTADSFITVGVALLLLDSLRPQRPA